MLAHAESKVPAMVSLPALVGVALLVARAESGASAHAVDTADSSQTIPYFSQVITVIEGENFTAGTGWEPRDWAHSPGYFASNSANDFMSRRAYLHADAHAPNGSTATATVRIGQASMQGCQPATVTAIHIHCSTSSCALTPLDR